MKRLTSLFFYFAAAIMLSPSVAAQDSTLYNKNEVFDPTFLTLPGT
jgi:hypothetical protein